PDDTISRFDPGSGNVKKFPVGSSPEGVAYRNGVVWVANSRSGTISQIDTQRNAKRDIDLGNEPTSLAFAGGHIWPAVLPSHASPRGGTLRVYSYPCSCSLDSDDPAYPGGFSKLQMLSLTNDGLVTYRRVDGLAGDETVPDLATAVPVPTNRGRTYTF